MWIKISLSLVVILSVFLIFVSTREGKFRYVAKGVIDAPVSIVFPYLSDLKKGNEWSPYVEVDPNMKNEFIGESDQVGAKLIFTGNKEAGSGVIELVSIIPNKSVELKLTMTAPVKAENKIEYLVDEVDGKTHFSWVMSGDGGFFGKLINIFIDCEKMVTKQFYKGIENLKKVAVRENSN